MDKFLSINDLYGYRQAGYKLILEGNLSGQLTSEVFENWDRTTLDSSTDWKQSVLITDDERLWKETPINRKYPVSLVVKALDSEYPIPWNGEWIDGTKLNAQRIFIVGKDVAGSLALAVKRNNGFVADNLDEPISHVLLPQPFVTDAKDVLALLSARFLYNSPAHPFSWIEEEGGDDEGILDTFAVPSDPLRFIKVFAEESDRDLISQLGGQLAASPLDPDCGLIFVGSLEPETALAAKHSPALKLDNRLLSEVGQLPNPANYVVPSVPLPIPTKLETLAKYEIKLSSSSERVRRLCQNFGLKVDSETPDIEYGDLLSDSFKQASKPTISCLVASIIGKDEHKCTKWHKSQLIMEKPKLKHNRWFVVVADRVKEETLIQLVLECGAELQNSDDYEGTALLWDQIGDLYTVEALIKLGVSVFDADKFLEDLELKEFNVDDDLVQSGVDIKALEPEVHISTSPEPMMVDEPSKSVMMNPPSMMMNPPSMMMNPPSMMNQSGSSEITGLRQLGLRGDRKYGRLDVASGIRKIMERYLHIAGIEPAAQNRAIPPPEFLLSGNVAEPPNLYWSHEHYVTENPLVGDATLIDGVVYNDDGSMKMLLKDLFDCALEDMGYNYPMIISEPKYVHGFLIAFMISRAEGYMDKAMWILEKELANGKSELNFGISARLIDAIMELKNKPIAFMPVATLFCCNSSPAYCFCEASNDYAMSELCQLKPILNHNIAGSILSHKTPIVIYVGNENKLVYACSMTDERFLGSREHSFTLEMPVWRKAEKAHDDWVKRNSPQPIVKCDACPSSFKFVKFDENPQLSCACKMPATGFLVNVNIFEQ